MTEARGAGVPPFPSPHDRRACVFMKMSLLRGAESGNTSDMIWTSAQLIHFFSINLTLRPGMVIITGIPAPRRL